MSKIAVLPAARDARQEMFMRSRPRPGRILAATLVVTVTLAMSACGQKGPLYMPDKAEKVELDESDPAREDEKKSTGTGY